MNPEQQQKLSQLVVQPVKWQCDLSRYTSFAIGGPAEAMVAVHQVGELQPLLEFLAVENIPWRIIGKGSNILVRDDGFPGVILRLGGELAAVSEEVGDDGLVVVRGGGGSSLAKLSWRCSERGITGLEFGCGIPGTLGGAVIMNAGAWGGDIGSILRGIKLVTAEGEINFSAGDLNFSYRCWKDFPAYQGRAVVASVELELHRGDAAAIMAYCKSLQDKRKATQPSEHANAGSFFMNPPDDSAGRLIEVSGLRGLKVGRAMVSERHGNFLLNTGGATADEVLRLMQIVQDKVKKDSGVCLEPEIHFI